MSQRSWNARRHRYTNTEQAESVPHLSDELLRAIGPVVYAVRTKDGRIKIGWTTDLPNRIRQVGYGRKSIIGIKPGTFADEQAIHQSLTGLAVQGREWYPWHPQVLAVVNAMRVPWGITPLEDIAA